MERLSDRVAVIGAGAAGSGVALALARLGWEVTVYEAKAFPRAKVCGEYISPAATAELESLISADQLRAAGAVRCDVFAIEHAFDGEERSVEWTSKKAAWALSRRSLDAALLALAVEAGAVARQPRSVRGVAYRDDGVVIQTADGDEDAFGFVVHADGMGRHDPAGPTPTIEGVVGHKCHLRVPGGVRGVRMRAGDGAYVGTIEVEDGLCTCALVADRTHIARSKADPDAMLAALWPRYNPAWRDGNWMACGVARSPYIEPGHARSVRLGNAAAAVDPVGGEGIGLALWSAVTLAGELGEPGTQALPSAKRRLASAYRRRLRTRRLACRIGAAMLMRPRLVRGVWPMLGSGAGRAVTVRPWVALTGK